MIPNVLDFVKVYRGIVDEELCDLILEEYRDSKEWRQAETGGGVNDHRTCYSISLSSENTNDRQKYIDDELFKCASEVINRYREDHPNIIVSEDTGYDLLRYEVGQYYREHTDSSWGEGFPRSLTASFHLNGDYEGGEFGFFSGEHNIRCGKGDVLAFPSNFMFPHQIYPVTSGTRYSIVTWYR